MRIRKTWCLALADWRSAPAAIFRSRRSSKKSDQIIRATSNGGRNEVVMLFAVVARRNGFFNRTCTGSYYAPRVVLTAAHCLEGVLNAGSPTRDRRCSSTSATTSRRTAPS